MARHGLSGKEKAAIALIAMGPELSAEVFKHMREDEIEELTLEIASMRTVPPEQKDKILGELYHMYLAQEYIAQGGIDYAKEILERALGSQKAMEIIERLTASLQVRPFEFIRSTDPGQLLTFIQGEHPQTIALILAFLQPEQAGTILTALPPEKQVDVTKRLALMEHTSPEVIHEVERVLEAKLSALAGQDSTQVGGVEALVEVLNQVDRATEKTILENLEEQEPELAEEIKRRLFTFEDIVQLDDKAVMRVLREIDLTRDLPMALKVASEEVKTKIFNNLSKRAVETLQEEMDYLGPVRLRDVEEAQQRIVNTIRKLEEVGEIIIARGGEDEIVV
ncbi:MAG: flagellar motor switch protein FliG [bacterium]|jgi:flagellar motor switch protein FliG|nr:flagellar motor switch protein FliG [Bacillota bacterium]